MNSNDLAKVLIDRLLTLKYKDLSISATTEFSVIRKEYHQAIINLVKEVINENYNHTIGILEAKVYAYEQIIANSNFKPMLQKRKIEETE